MSNKVKFGDFEFDLVRGELLKNGERFSINGKEFDLLEIFAKNPFSDLTHKYLISHLSHEEAEISDDVVFDGVANLRKLISRVRDTIGDSNEKYIVTRNKVGYKFLPDEEPSKPVTDFERFFGKITQPVRMVFAFRELNKPKGTENDSKKLEEVMSEVMSCNFDRKVGRDMDPKPTAEGVTQFVASEDIKASTWVTSLLSANVNAQFTFHNDEDMRAKYNSCIFAFGLMNTYTLKLAEDFDGKLFKVRFDYSPVNSDLYTDNIEINGIVPSKDFYQKDHDDFIIARIVSRPNVDDSYTLTFCLAGRTAQMTSVSGHWLVKHFHDELLPLYDTTKGKELSKDSLVVCVRSPTNSDEDGNYRRAKIFKYTDPTDGEEKQLINWARLDE